MAYSDFDLETAVRTFGLTEARGRNLFAAVAPREPSPLLRGLLDEQGPLALGINTEQARREYLISPILSEAKRQVGETMMVFPGITFEVDKSQGLSGLCDYLISRSPEYFYLQAPIAAVVEAKKEDLIGGLGQCAAAMVGIQVFNERKGTPTPAVFGSVTSGNLWRFLKLEGATLSVDVVEYHLGDLPKLLGILVAIVRG
jgi:hypothetical protein